MDRPPRQHEKGSSSPAPKELREDLVIDDERVAAEDQTTRQINTKAIVDAAFNADESDPGDLDFDRGIFEAEGKTPSAERIASIVEDARQRAPTPVAGRRRPPTGPLIPPPERAFSSSVVVSSQRGDDVVIEPGEPVTARRLRPRPHPRPPTGPMLPMAGSARLDARRRPLTGPLPPVHEAAPAASARRGILFLVLGASVGLAIGLGLGLFRDERAPSPSPAQGRTAAARANVKTTHRAPTRPAAQPEGSDPDPRVASPLAIPGSMVALQRRLKLVPKELEKLTMIRKRLDAKDWKGADEGLAELSEPLRETTEIRLWRARIDLLRGRAAEARQACIVMLGERLPAPWPAEIGLTLAEAALELGEHGAAKSAADRALQERPPAAVKERLEAVLDRVPARDS